MKKYLILLVAYIFLLTGCNTMINTPSKKVEDFLNKYQRQDKEIINQLEAVISEGSFEFLSTQKDRYEDIMKRQYKNLKYNIKEETIDGNNATVEVEIEVYDYNSVINEAQEYYIENQSEFVTQGSIDDSKFLEFKLDKMEKTKERIKYTLYFTLTKENKKWFLNDISETDRQKIHGLYNS